MLREPEFIQHKATRPALALAVILSSSSCPTGPSIIFSACAMFLNRNGMLTTLMSSTIGPIVPALTRSNWMAPIWVCSMVLLCAELGRGIHLDRETPVGGGLQLLADAFGGRDRRVAGRLHVG